MRSLVNYPLVKERLLQAIDPVTLLEYLGARHIVATGCEVRCTCPVHRGCDPNFSYRTDKGIWTCFSHGCGGDTPYPRDIITLVSLVKGVSISEAVTFLCEFAGVEPDGVTRYDPKLASDIETRGTAKVFARPLCQKLPSIDEAVLEESRKNPLPEYILQRFSDNILREFEVGYCLSGEFAGRILVPIRDSEGRLVGLSGRLPTDDKEEIRRHGKYLHKADFSKGGVLYNLHGAKGPIEESGYAIVTEGFFDCMRAWQYGVKNAIAVMGTSMTLDQVALLRRHTGRVKIALDGDAPGRLAIPKMHKRLCSIFNVDVLTLPEGRDLGDLSREEMLAVLGSSQDR